MLKAQVHDQGVVILVDHSIPFGRTVAFFVVVNNQLVKHKFALGDRVGMGKLIVGSGAPFLVSVGESQDRMG